MSSDAPTEKPEPKPARGRRRWAFAMLATAALFALAVPVPPVAAHCDPGTEGYSFGILTTCPYNETAEEVVDALNAASDGSMVYMLVKDYRFHPEVVDVVSGGTVVLVYADLEHNDNHDPKSSGSTGDAAYDLARPVPVNPGKCFSIGADQGGFLTSLGETYPITFRYDSTTHEVWKSRGVQSGTPIGDLTGAQVFKKCPAGSVSFADGYSTAVLPFHCGLHGGALTDPDLMRAGIRIHAA